MAFNLSSRQLDTLHRGAVKTCIGLGAVSLGLTVFVFANMFKGVKTMSENPGSDLKAAENWLQELVAYENNKMLA